MDTNSKTPVASFDDALLQGADLGSRRALFEAAPPRLVAALGIRMMHVGSGVAFAVDSLDKVSFNRVVGLAPGDVTAGGLDRIETFYGKSGVEFAIQLLPVAETPEIAALLVERGYVRREPWAMLQYGGGAAVEAGTDLRVERIGPESAAVHSAITVHVFDLPSSLRPWLAATVGCAGWRHYLAFDGAVPVAASTSFFGEGYAWFGMTCSLDTHRRRGAQSALLARRIRDAREAGCDRLFTKTDSVTGNQSYRNLLRLGFRPVFLRANYVRRIGPPVESNPRP